MKRLTQIILSSIIVFRINTHAQKTINEFQSIQNPLYWKNKKPYPSYWQQDVHYKIQAILNDTTDIITGKQALTYYNNSPDTLTTLYFHVYNNAQCEDSYLADLYKNNNYYLHFSKYRKNKLGTTIQKLSVNNENVETELDNTVLKVKLKIPLKPNEIITINIDFKTYFDKEAIRNRMKLFKDFGYKHYDVVHWYPRLSVYDAKMGWDTQQHMDHEFYGDYGVFDVEFTLPNHYILDATGTLLNETEVLPDTLRKKLDLSNFKNKPWNEKPSSIIKSNGTNKTWKFNATNVHDFALTADPTYRIDEKTFNNIKCVALVQEPHVAGWLNAASYLAKIIETNSKLIGTYHYPKTIAADAKDGMEYPMLTLDGGFDPEYRDLLIHEVTHNWFFGMVGSNETYRAFLDEGFTQFYTAETYQAIEGATMVTTPPHTKLQALYETTVQTTDDQIYNSYMYAQNNKQERVTLNTHSDDYNGGIRHGGGYGAVYTKTGAMLKNLEYVLGKDLFTKAMQHYFNLWKFCHPYPEDFKNTIIQFTKVDLNWFFDQWLDTPKQIDYKIESIKKTKNKFEYIITFKRKGDMQMPIDFTVIDSKDSTYHFYIPNTWFKKQTTANVLPQWVGWGKVKPNYQATVQLTSPIKDVIIDPTNRLADVYMLDNSTTDNLKFEWDIKKANQYNWKQYIIKTRPSLWYNGVDGLKIGAFASGNFMNTYHIFDALVLYNTQIGQIPLPASFPKNEVEPVSFIINYKTSLQKYLLKSNVYSTVKSMDGLKSLLVGLEKRMNDDKTRYYIQYKSMLREKASDLNYLIYNVDKTLAPQYKVWDEAKLNSSFNIGVDYNYNLEYWQGLLNFNIRNAAFTNDFDYSYIQTSSINKSKFQTININTRLFAQLGFGLKQAKESMLYVSAANPEDLMDNKYTRSFGFIPQDFGIISAVSNHFSMGGGLNLRGYNSYLLPNKPIGSDSTTFHFQGTTGFSGSCELEFGKLFHFLSFKKMQNKININPYLFSDAGFINENKPNELLKLSNVLFDAGVGFTFTYNYWGLMQNIKPIVIRFDIPLFVNRLPFNETAHFQWRWLIGINTTF